MEIDKTFISEVTAQEDYLSNNILKFKINPNGTNHYYAPMEIFLKFKFKLKNTVTNVAPIDGDNVAPCNNFLNRMFTKIEVRETETNKLVFNSTNLETLPDLEK